MNSCVQEERKLPACVAQAPCVGHVRRAAAARRESGGGRGRGAALLRLLRRVQGVLRPVPQQTVADRARHRRLAAGAGARCCRQQSRVPSSAASCTPPCPVFLVPEHNSGRTQPHSAWPWCTDANSHRDRLTACRWEVLYPMSWPEPSGSDEAAADLDSHPRGGAGTSERHQAAAGGTGGRPSDSSAVRAARHSGLLPGGRHQLSRRRAPRERRLTMPTRRVPETTFA